MAALACSRLRKLLPALALLACIAAVPATARTQPLTEVVSPLQPLPGQHRDAAGLRLGLRSDWHKALANQGSFLLLGFPGAAGRRLDLALEPYSPAPAGATIIAAGQNGPRTIAHDDQFLYKGRVQGEPGSIALLAVSPRGIMARIRRSGEDLFLSPLDHRSRDTAPHTHVLYTGAQLQTILPPNLLTPPLEDNIRPPGLERGAMTPDRPSRGAGDFYICRVAVDCDYEFWSAFQDTSAALDYVFVLFASMSLFYERDLGTKLALTFVRVWTTPDDPYSYTGSAPDGLEEFRDYWREHHGMGDEEFVRRDLAHLLSGRAMRSWGYAGVLCHYDWGYSICGSSQMQPTLAANLYRDERTSGHEIGHNFDGIHTHCFDPPVDQCATEKDCNQVQVCPATPGTIMSYCEMCAIPGDKVLTRFCQENIDRIRSYLDDSCLLYAQDPCYVDWRNTAYENGTAQNPYNTIKEGVLGVHPGGTLIVAPGDYDEPMELRLPMNLTGSGGPAAIGR